MKALLSFLVQQIVDSPEAVKIEETTDEQGTVILTLYVAEADMGKVIGKQGKIIHAIRLLLKIKAIKAHQHVRLEIAEPTSKAPNS